MINKSFLLATNIVIMAVILFAGIGNVAAQVKKKSACPAGDSEGNFGLCQTAEDSGIKALGISKKKPVEIVADIIAAALSFLGVIFFIIVLYAGIRWMTAMGASDKVEKAKETLEAAGIGLLVVLASYAIATFIFTQLGLK